MNFLKAKVGGKFWWFPHPKLLPLNPKLNNKRDNFLLIISLKVFKVLKLYALELFVVRFFSQGFFFFIYDAQLFIKGAKEKGQKQRKKLEQ
jgi:hypothetical protein